MKWRSNVFGTVLLCVLMLLCSCGSGDSGRKSQEQLAGVSFQVEEGGYKTVTPAPSEKKMYVYKGYRMEAEFVKEDDAEELDQDLKKEYRQFFENMGIEPELKEKDISIAGKDGRQLIYAWTEGNGEEKTDISAIASGFQTETGTYIFRFESYSSENEHAAKKMYDALVESIEITGEEDKDVYTADKGQACGLIFSVPGWKYRGENAAGDVTYSEIKGLNGASLAIHPIKSEKLDEAVMKEAVMDAYGGTKAISETTVKKQEEMEAAVGTAVKATMELTVHNTVQETTMDSEVVFWQNEDGKPVCCFLCPYDGEAGIKYDYASLLNSLRYEDESNV